jgi:hypothetical protein
MPRTIVMALAILSVSLSGAAVKPRMTVWKTATCGCCAKWVEHMKANGFDVDVKVVPATAPFRAQAGLPEKVASCHTAVVGGYSLEGHVPAADVKRLLKEKPNAKGLAVPGMPIGSPGMEAGSRRDAYSVVLVKEGGATSVYQSYTAK